MAHYLDKFYNVTVSEVRHHRTKCILTKAEIEEGPGHCGVAHVKNIKWRKNGDVEKAVVELWATPFTELNPLAKKTGHTAHRLMMEGLSLWERFKKFKLRVCDEKGRYRRNFDVTNEPELFYGFTRKNKGWYSTSCTLNCWIRHEDWKQAPDVVYKAGKRKSDKSAVKSQLINLMPASLWFDVVIRKLLQLTPQENEYWSIEWAMAGLGLKGKERQLEELERMRRLVSLSATGSALYKISFVADNIGSVGLSGIKAFASVLQEEMCSTVQIINLTRNDLTDEHVKLLGSAIAKSEKLWKLVLMDNNITDEGCIALLRSLPKSMKLLDLEENSIGLEGCEEVVKFLKSSSLAVDIVLDENPGWEVGGYEIGELKWRHMEAMRNKGRKMVKVRKPEGWMQLGLQQLKCIGMHGLERELCWTRRHICDNCKHRIEPDTEMACCWTCNYDICNTCIRELVGVGGTKTNVKTTKVEKEGEQDLKFLSTISDVKIEEVKGSKENLLEEKILVDDTLQALEDVAERDYNIETLYAGSEYSSAVDRWRNTKMVYIEENECRSCQSLAHSKIASVNDEVSSTKMASIEEKESSSSQSIANLKITSVKDEESSSCQSLADPEKLSLRNKIPLCMQCLVL